MEINYFILIAYFAALAFLLISRDVFYKRLNKQKSLIQNLESSIDTQNQLYKRLSNKLWEIENPPKYKVGQKFKNSEEGDCMIIEVIAGHSDYDTTSCCYIQSYWYYYAIILKTGERICL